MQTEEIKNQFIIDLREKYVNNKIKLRDYKLKRNVTPLWEDIIENIDTWHNINAVKNLIHAQDYYLNKINSLREENQNILKSICKLNHKTIEENKLFCNKLVKPVMYSDDEWDENKDAMQSS